MKNNLFIKIFLVLSIHLSIFSKTVNELVDIVANSNINMQYYFWIENRNAFLSQQRNNKTYSVWHYTSNRKWRPIHNANAYDEFPARGNIFSSVVLDKENETIIIGNKINNNNSDINDLLDMLASKTHNIGWYFWITNQKAFLLSTTNDNNVRMWHYTRDRKWQPIHNVGAYDGFPLALKTMNIESFNPSNGILKTGSKIPSNISDDNSSNNSDDNSSNNSDDNSDNNSDDNSNDNSMAEYKVILTTIWSASNFPTNFPSGRHFSPVIGMTHNKSVKLFEVGSKATDGIVEVAETGRLEDMEDDINNYISSKRTDLIIKGPSLRVSSSGISFKFNINSSHPFMSWVSMIAPSPDWFIGVNSLNLLENGKWVKEKTMKLKVYDAGSDSGDTFNASNRKTNPQANITRLTTSSSDTDFKDGKHRDNDKFIANVIIYKVEDPSLNTFNARTFYANNCTTCHGSDGKGSTVIQGRSESEYMRVLMSFKDGSRTNPSGMSAILKGFDVNNLASLAKYLSTL